MNQKRKMAFYEIQKGELALDVQAAFETAQKQSYIHNSASKITLEIIVFPPPDRQSNFGQIQYAIRETLPSTRSMKLTTQLNNEGIITADGTNAISVLQEELQFDEPQIINIKEGNQ